MLKVLFLSSTLFWSSLALSGSCDSISCTAKITNLYPHGGNGKIYIEVDADKSSLNCSLDQGRFITLKETSKRHSEIYSMLLAATIAEKEIRLRIVDGSSDCELSYTMLQL